MTNRSARLEILFFFFFFCVSVSDDFHKTYSIQKVEKYAVCTFQPRNLTGWGSEGVNVYRSGGGQSFLECLKTFGASLGISTLTPPTSELRSCVKVEVAVLGSPFLSPYGLCGRKATLNSNLGTSPHP